MAPADEDGEAGDGEEKEQQRQQHHNNKLAEAWLRLQYLLSFSVAGVAQVSLAWGATVSVLPWAARWWHQQPGGSRLLTPVRVQSSSMETVLKSPRSGPNLSGLTPSPRFSNTKGGRANNPFAHDWTAELPPPPSSPTSGGSGVRRLSTLRRSPTWRMWRALRIGLLFIFLAYIVAFYSFHVGHYKETDVRRTSKSLENRLGLGLNSSGSLGIATNVARKESKEGTLQPSEEALLAGTLGLALGQESEVKMAGAGGNSSTRAGDSAVMDEERKTNSSRIRKEKHVTRPWFVAAPPKSKRRAVDWRKKPRMAICLVGGAREFQLTGPSIMRHLLRAYDRADIFLHSPLDENAHKLSLLAAVAPSVVAVRIAPDVPINESLITDRLLANVRSGPAPITRQGLMQQFKGVEMCITMITAFERKHRFQYRWVMRTRVDGFWMGRPPSLAEFDKTGYTIPAGSDWGGLNDRLGVGRRSISWLGLRRLSILRPLADDGGYAQLNAERTYRAQMEFLNVKVTRASFPFCILSHKKANPGFPVAVSLSSSAALNGAKCRPCVPTVTGEESAQYIAALPEKVFGPETYGVDLCEAEDDWAAEWRDIFDKDAGPHAAQARKYLEGRTIEECIRDWGEFREWVPIWDAPPAHVLCLRAGLGSLHELGYPRGEWAAFLDYLTPNSIIYSMGIGEDYTFDAQVQRVLKGDIHAFDSTPAALKWIGIKTDELPSTWHHHPWLLSPAKDGLLPIYALDIQGQRFTYGTRWPRHANMSSLPTKLSVEFKTIETTMRELNHSFIDLLRIGGHLSLHDDLFDIWISKGKTPPVCQVAVSSFREDKHYGSPKGRKKLLALRKIGLELAVCIQKDRDEESCLFFSVIHCPASFINTSTNSSSTSTSS